MSTLFGLELEEAVKTGRRVLAAHIPFIKELQGGGGLKLRGADMSGECLVGMDLKNTTLNGAKLCGANLCDADLSGANLSQADLTGAILTGANFSSANLLGAVMPVELREVNLRVFTSAGGH